MTAETLFDSVARSATAMGEDTTVSSCLRTGLINGILQMNHGATSEFLAMFGDAELLRYMDHLMASRSPRGGGSRWIHCNETPGIMAREPLD